MEVSYPPLSPSGAAITGRPQAPALQPTEQAQARAARKLALDTRQNMTRQTARPMASSAATVSAAPIASGPVSRDELLFRPSCFLLPSFPLMLS